MTFFAPFNIFQA